MNGEDRLAWIYSSSLFNQLLLKHCIKLRTNLGLSFLFKELLAQID